MKTKRQILVKALVVLITLFAGLKAKAQFDGSVNFTYYTTVSLPWTPICSGENFRGFQIHIKNNDTCGIAISEVRLTGSGDTNLIETVNLTDENETLLGGLVGSSIENKNGIFILSFNVPSGTEKIINVNFKLKPNKIGSFSIQATRATYLNLGTATYHYPNLSFNYGQVNVGCNPIVSIRKDWQPDTMCVNVGFWPNFDVTRSYSQIVKYEWRINDSDYYSCTNCSGYLSKYMQIANGVNKVKITLTDQDNRSGSDSLYIYGIPQPHPIITVSKNTLCKDNDEVILECKSTVGLSKWGFDYNYPPTSNASKVFHVLDAGSYGFSAIGLNGCTFDTSITIYGLPSPQTPHALVHDRLLVCTTQADSFIWCSGPNATPMASSKNSPSIPITRADWYSVIVFNKYGCSEHSETIWGDYSMTGISEINLENTIVYPNPFTDKINIESEIGSKFVFININGQVMYEGLLIDQHTELNLDLPTGIYILQITNGEKISHQKLVKE